MSDALEQLDIFNADLDSEDLDESLVESAAPFLLETPMPPLDVTPRPYQQEALAAWSAAGARGMVVLPTGAGKTMLALTAIAAMQVSTLVVAPTIDLLHQWHDTICARFGMEPDAVGMIGGGFRTRRPVTVITYDSAAMPRRDLSDIGLLVFDEAHHLPSASYRTIATRCAAPFRLGLSATLERSDGRHDDLTELIGPTVYERQPAALARDKHIADYKATRVPVDLTDDEQVRYDQLTAQYSWYMAASRRKLMLLGCGNLFEALIRQSGHDPAAREALRAHREARMLAMNASRKLGAVEELLEKHQDDKVIVFSEWNSLVHDLSRQLALPAITYRTAQDERRAILDGFRRHHYSKIVTGRVLNEGVDVPDANVAIVVSGSASTREYIQRLGRVLRPKPGQASLYEIVARGTSEVKTAAKRKPKESGPAA
ncbi:ATP-dependent helicase [Capsulimonas corticalis]|uniref:DNA 3'-5' helicase n=1 Tax=Capsulimonas corticalis TaxID=2219043 RepID=A0A402D752_9BACT|nr:DEAD/DEAH box helicase [Capsulimonas corticalis]BDI29126.1 ATP-dependent helicase [Capsulimonas corticalis]